jgi:oligosaccharide repeat unit polymerase
MIYTQLFTIATIIGIISLIKIQQTGRRTLFDPGLIVVVLFSLCYLLPAYLFFIDPNNVAWQFMSIDVQTVEMVSLYGFVFMVFFTIFYIAIPNLFSSKINFVSTIKRRPELYLFLIVLLCIIRNFIFWKYGVRSGDYIDQYVVRAAIPVLLNQMLNVSGGVLWMFIYALLSSCFSSCSRNKSLSYIGIVFLIFFVEMLLSNSRSMFVFLTIVTIVTYIFYNRPFGIKKEIFYSSVFVLIMHVFSFKRELHFSAASVSLLNILIPAEFIMIYRNAAHLVSMSGTLEFVQPPGNSYLQALTSFIPKQLNEDKFDLSSWYVKEYFPNFADVGGGLAFGFIPEALVNWGLISVVLQAFVIAFIIGVSYKYAQRTKSSGPNIWTLFYLFCFANLYQLIRSESFSIISALILGFIIPYLFLLAFKCNILQKENYRNG